MVVFGFPTRRHFLCLGHSCEFFNIQQFIPKATLERLSVPFSHGAPGSMYKHFTSVRSNQRRIAWAMNSGPLSLRMWPGAPLTANRSAKTSMISRDVIRRFTSKARHSLVYSSTSENHFKARPFVVRSKMKSQVHT